MTKIPDLNSLKKVQKRISPYIHNTAVMTSRLVNEYAETNVFFKCDNFQRMGAFKMRGAINAILNLPSDERNHGVATHSSGNFAQALSLSAKLLSVPATIVMPSTAPSVKKNAVRSYGAEIVECEPSLKSREETLNKVLQKKSANFLHPSNNIDVIAGNATAFMEFFISSGPFDAVIVPVGGGGLLAGTALAAHHLNPECQVYAGEPMGADDAWRSLQSGKIEPSIDPLTIADGLKTQLGDKNFPIIRKYVKDIIRVEEEEIVSAMKFIWQRMKIIIEPSSAVAFAALLKNKKAFHSKKTGIILSGGNVDLSNLPF